MKYLIKSKELYLEHETIPQGTILVEDGKIVAINEEALDCEIIDLSSMRVMPGLIDQHVHGANGVDTMDATYEALNKMSQYKINEGVTSFLATTVTSSIEKTHRAIINVADTMEKGTDGAKILGTFLESRYISVKYKGAHPEKYIADISLEEIKEIIDISKGTLKSMIIAPEKENAIEAIKYIVSRGVKVSLGHTEATYEQMLAGIRAGGTIATHAYNAMSPLHHREPGAVGAIMNSPAITAEVICDGIHVHPAAIEALIRAKGTEKIALVTDCIMAGGMSNGKVMLGELEVTVDEGIARIENGALAGSTLNLMNAVKNLVQMTSINLKDAVNMATINPARNLGLEKEIGSIAVGKKADIIALDDDYNVKFVMVNGNIMTK